MMFRKAAKDYTEMAVQLAEKGGWNPKEMPHDFFGTLSIWRKFTLGTDKRHFFFHPSFWRGLQKGLGAKEPRHKWTKNNGAAVDIIDWASNTMHSLMDHLIDGKTLEDFFKEVILHHQK